MKLLPNKIQLDILKRHVGPFVFCFFTVMFLLLMQFLILYIDRLIGKGLPLGIIIELILTNLAYMVVLAAPMAMLVASLMAFGKFTELNELTALRAAGINPFHTIKPVLIAATLMSIFLIWFSNDVLPDSNQRARSLFLDIRTKKPGFDLEENAFYDGIDGYTFLVKDISSENDSLYNVTLFQEASSEKNNAIIKAQRGFLKSSNDETLTLFLYDGSVMRTMNRRKDGQNIKAVEKTGFNRYRLSFDLSEMAFSRSDPKKHSRNDRTMNVQAMAAVVDTLEMEIVSEMNKLFKEHQFEQPQPIAEEAVRPFYSSGETDGPPLYKSTYLMLQNTENRNIQQQLQNAALGELRSYRSSYENLKVNADWRTKRIAKYWVEIYKKFSIPIACVIFVLIGAPIGMYTKKGNIGYASIIAAVFLTFFWISIIQGEKLADRLFVSPFTGMWFSNILMGIIGIIMTLQICTSFRISNLWRWSDD
jgi:lipopolysaccharide export system permease protein